MTYAAHTTYSPQSFQMSSFTQPMLNNAQVDVQSTANDAGMRNSNRSVNLNEIKTASVLPRATSTRSDKVGHALINGLSAIGLGGVGAATYLAFSKTSVAVPMTLSTVGTAGLACVAGAAVSAGLAVYNAARSCVPSKRLNESLNAQFKGTDKLISHFESGQIIYNANLQKFELNSDLMSQQDMHHFENEFLHNKHGQTLFGSHIGETRVKDMINKINQNIIAGSNADQAYATAAKTMNKELKYSQTRKIVTTALLTTAAGGAAGAIAGGLGAPVGAAIGLAFGLLGAKGGHVAYKKMTADNMNNVNSE
ncbi:MAG TPA: hypothetical protein DHW71_08805 [Gammaproteobacteria bacterium]|nr:hypothetical protein [Gammaproteobacteria bacterium]HCK93073.1 hypothetical protein [Gammaproteobacteria bacterium]|tara:strand:- start:31 stop:957 length:927 start_codon:yes stop_codon:yes gene_type:complete